MDLKTLNFDEEIEFEEMVKKMNDSHINSSLLDSPTSNKYCMEVRTPETCSPKYLSTSTPGSKMSSHHSYETCAIKNLSFAAADEDEEDEGTDGFGEIDLNKTYSSKTMDHRQLSLMLAALEDEEERSTCK